MYITDYEIQPGNRQTQTDRLTDSDLQKMIPFCPFGT